MRRVHALPVVLALLLAACGAAGGGPEAGGAPRVAAAFYPLAWLAAEIGGDDVEVVNLTPPGVEPHDLELTPGQVREVQGADLVLYLGEGFQPAIEEVAAGRDGPSVDVLAGESDADPHVWLDPVRAAAAAALVADHLSELNPGAADLYAANLEHVAAALGDLDDEYTAGLAECARRSIVVSHDAFGYLAERYDLEQVGIAGLDPEAEPSPRRIAEVADFARDNDVTTIFFETLVSPAIAETIATEVGVETAVLDPIESAPDQGDYLSAMRANLDELRAALDCD